MDHGYSSTALIKRKGRRLGLTLGMLACAVVGAVGNPALAGCSGGGEGNH